MRKVVMALLTYSETYLTGLTLPGIWLSPDAKSPPILTLFGSTNLNIRSAHLDTELSFMMVLPSDEAADQASGSTPIRRLQNSLQEEVFRIRENTVDWEGWKRQVRTTTKMLVWAIKGML